MKHTDDIRSWAFTLLLGQSLPVSAALCPESPPAAVNEYYSAIRRMDFQTLEALTGSRGWIQSERIVEMSKGLDHFEIISVRKIAGKDHTTKWRVHVRVREYWKDPSSQSFGYFFAVPSGNCWRIEDFGTEEEE